MAFARPNVPIFSISVVNEHFRSTNEQDHPDLDSARRQAIRGAVAIAADEVAGGKDLFIAEVTIHEKADRVARFVVSVGASPLLV